MNFDETPYQATLGSLAVQAQADERADFITKTYLHLAGAIGLFVILEAVYLNLLDMESITRMMFHSQVSWLIVVGLFMVVSYIADNWARSAVSKSTQYMGLGLYVVAESILFAPLLYIANRLSPDGSVITSAAVATLGLFGVMTAIVFFTRKDFSFLRSILMFGGIAAFGFIIVAAVTGFNPGPIFTYAMIAFACSFILYDTSNVLHHYRIGQHVAASLALFASVALLFWYVIQLFLSRRN
jgi:FtsH-binding integral membrane protein